MTPEAHLVDTSWFRAAIAVPISISIGVGLFFTEHTSLSLARSPEGMNNFLQMFKLPLGIASLALPIVAVVAANHRSMQTAQQIKAQNSQNIFSNHLEHKDFFAKFIDERKPFGSLTIQTARLYEALFPKAVDGDLKPNQALFREILTDVRYTLIAISHQISANISTKNFTLPSVGESTLRNRTRALEKLLSEKLIPIEATEINDLHEDPVDSLNRFQRKLYTLTTGLVKCANFHRYYMPEQEAEEIVELCSELNEHHNEILPVYQFYKSIKLATDEYLDASGSLKINDGKDGDRFRQRLMDIHRSMVMNGLSFEHIETIFDHHLEYKHRLTFYLHAPEEWRPFLKLTPKEQDKICYFKSTKP